MTHKEIRNLVLGAIIGASGLTALAAFSEFQAGTPIKAADVNAKFNDLDARVAAGLKLPFSGTIGSADAGTVGVNVVSSDPAKTAIKGLGGNYGVVGDTLSLTGIGVLAANSSSAPGGAALEINGGIKVSGSNKAAFVHVASAANSISNSTCIDSPLTNAKPNAILIVTQNYNPGGSGGVYNNQSIGVYYGVGAFAFPNKWCIFNQNTSSAIPVNASFNVLVINQ